MFNLYQVKTKEDKEHVHEILSEYYQWLKARLSDEWGITVDFKTRHEEEIAKLDISLPSEGRIILAVVGDETVGIAYLRRINDEIAEIKRMYVRPAFHRKGIGRALLKDLVSVASELGYSRIRLDTARFMKEAHSLYQAEGFEEIEPYPESEIPEESRWRCTFMEKELPKK